LLKKTVKITPSKLLTPVVVFLGVMSNIASDAGYVILIPIGALMFMACGRHPMAGLAAAFAGVSGGFSANLVVGTTDPLLSGITQEAVKLVDPNWMVTPTCNWFFMIVSTVLITVLGTFITEKIVEPRLGKYTGGYSESDFSISEVSKDENRALKWANISLLAYIALVVVACIPQNSPLRNAETGSLIAKAPFMTGIIVLIAFMFFIPACVYGFVSKKFTSEKDVCVAMGKAMESMGSYIALAFVAAQFIKYFEYTNLGTILAVSGANLLQSTGLGMIPLMIPFTEPAIKYGSTPIPRSRSMDDLASLVWMVERTK